MKQYGQNEVLNQLENEIKCMSFTQERDKQTMLRNILKLKHQQVNILVVGATGVGKSSTINALFNCEKAVVGRGVDPQTMHIEKYELEGITFYDSPGLGDGVEQDELHGKGIIDLLHKLDDDGQPLIDLVLVLLDGGSRDYGTAYRLLEKIIVPSLETEHRGRILVGINQADMAMKGRGWDELRNKPTPELEAFLEQKATSTQRRIKESSGVDITPVYYSAGYQDELGEQQPYNLAKLLFYIVEHMPQSKRFSISSKVKTDPKIYQSGSDVDKYLEKTQQSFLDSLLSSVKAGVEKGAEIVAEVVSSVAGSLFNGAKNLFGKVFSIF